MSSKVIGAAAAAGLAGLVGLAQVFSPVPTYVVSFYQTASVSVPGEVHQLRAPIRFNGCSIDFGPPLGRAKEVAMGRLDADQTLHVWLPLPGTGYCRVIGER